MTTRTPRGYFLITAVVTLAWAVLLGAGCASTHTSIAESTVTRPVTMSVDEGSWNCHWVVRGKYAANVCQYVHVDAPRATIARRP